MRWYFAYTLRPTKVAILQLSPCWHISMMHISGARKHLQNVLPANYSPHIIFYSDLSMRVSRNDWSWYLYKFEITKELLYSFHANFQYNVLNIKRVSKSPFCEYYMYFRIFKTINVFCIIIQFSWLQIRKIDYCD